MTCFLESGSLKLPSIIVLGLMCDFICSSIYVIKSSTSVFSVYIIQNGCVILSACYSDQYEVSFSVSSSKCWLDIYFSVIRMMICACFLVLSACSIFAPSSS